MKNPSKAEVITEIIVKSIQAKHPKTRYVGGNGAKPILFLRSILSDKLFDYGILKSMGL